VTKLGICVWCYACGGSVIVVPMEPGINPVEVLYGPLARSACCGAFTDAIEVRVEI